MQGGEDVKRRTNESLIKGVGKISSTKRILIIPWTTESIEKETEYRNVFSRYFKDSGFLDVLFLEKRDSNLEMAKKISSVDVIYLPGGDPDVLYLEVEKRSLQNNLRKFKGIIIGNSAGAIVLSKGAKHEGKFYPGFELVKFFVTVHFTMTKEFTTEKTKETVINIPENMWVAISD
ncbi:MAG: Type 1 glutamine amidotransferase-like domain-containing protein [Thermoplasmataceae archaeon]